MGTSPQETYPRYAIACAAVAAVTGVLSATILVVVAHVALKISRRLQDEIEPRLDAIEESLEGRWQKIEVKPGDIWTEVALRSPKRGRFPISRKNLALKKPDVLQA